MASNAAIEALRSPLDGCINSASSRNSEAVARAISEAVSTADAAAEAAKKIPIANYSPAKAAQIEAAAKQVSASAHVR